MTPRVSVAATSNVLVGAGTVNTNVVGLVVPGLVPGLIVGREPDGPAPVELPGPTFCPLMVRLASRLGFLTAILTANGARSTCRSPAGPIETEIPACFS